MSVRCCYVRDLLLLLFSVLSSVYSLNFVLVVIGALSCCFSIWSEYCVYVCHYVAMCCYISALVVVMCVILHVCIVSCVCMPLFVVIVALSVVFVLLCV